MTAFHADDLMKPPRWIIHGAEIALVKGDYMVFVITTFADGTCAIHHQGDLMQVAGSQQDAVALCEATAKRWWPSDPKPLTPEETPAIGTKTAEGLKVVSTNPFAAPV